MKLTSADRKWLGQYGKQRQQPFLSRSYDASGRGWGAGAYDNLKAATERVVAHLDKIVSTPTTGVTHKIYQRRSGGFALIFQMKLIRGGVIGNTPASEVGE